MSQSKKMLQKVEPQQLGRLKPVGGSDGDVFNQVLASQAPQTALRARSHPEESNRARQATLQALLGISPRDEIEGMMAAQLIGTHNAAMDCFRRAMIEDQSFEGRHDNLILANKLAKSYTMLAVALDRHRGKGQQKMTIKHVHVYSGGQAIVGTINRGSRREREAAIETEPDRARGIAHDPSTPMRCEHPERASLPIATGSREEAVQDARRPRERRAPRQRKRA